MGVLMIRAILTINCGVSDRYEICVPGYDICEAANELGTAISKVRSQLLLLGEANLGSPDVTAFPFSRTDHNSSSGLILPITFD